MNGYAIARTNKKYGNLREVSWHLNCGCWAAAASQGFHSTDKNAVKQPLKVNPERGQRIAPRNVRLQDIPICGDFTIWWPSFLIFCAYWHTAAMKCVRAYVACVFASLVKLFRGQIKGKKDAPYTSYVHVHGLCLECGLCVSCSRNGWQWWRRMEWALRYAPTAKLQHT